MQHSNASEVISTALLEIVGRFRYLLFDEREFRLLHRCNNRLRQCLIVLFLNNGLDIGTIEFQCTRIVLLILVQNHGRGQIRDIDRFVFVSTVVAVVFLHERAHAKEKSKRTPVIDTESAWYTNHITRLIDVGQFLPVAMLLFFVIVLLLVRFEFRTRVVPELIIEICLIHV